MQNYPTLYWVEYWDSFNHTTQKTSGCVFASTFAEAMSKVEDYYGDDLCTVKLKMLEEGNCLEFKDYEEAEKIEKWY